MQYTNLSKFLPKIGEAAAKVGLIEPNHVTSARSLQAHAYILKEIYPQEDFAHPDARFETVADPFGEHMNPIRAKIEHYVRETPINQEHFRQVYNQIGNLPIPKGVPWMSDLFKAEGVLKKEYTEPMLAAQSAARVKYMIDGGEPHDRLQDVLVSDRYIKHDSSEPDYVRSAQSLGHLTRLMMAAIRENPSLAQEPTVQTALMSAEMLASQSLKVAAKTIKDTGRADVADKMMQARQELRQDVQDKASTLVGGAISTRLSTSVHVEKLREGLATIAARVPDGQAIQSLMPKHLENVSQLHVFGFSLAGTNKAAPSSWLAKVQPNLSGGPQHGRG